MRVNIIFLLIGLIYLGVGRANEVHFSAQFAPIHQQFMASVESGDQLEDLTAELESLIESEGRHPLLISTLASVTTLQGREAWMPWNKLRYTERGLEGLEKSVAQLSPNDATTTWRGVSVHLVVVLTAAKTMLAVPEFFGYRSYGLRLLKDEIDGAQLKGTPHSFQADFLLSYAEQVEEPSRRSDLLDQIIELAPATPSATKALQLKEEINE